MKKIMCLLIFTSIMITTFSQQMVVQKTDGTNMFLDMNTIETINFIIPCPGTPTVDYDGKTYNTVLIGDQCWLKENLDVGTIINGDLNQTDNSIIEKYCYNNDPSNCTTYGGLYQWDEAMQYVTTSGTKGICPEGWHIPTFAEFQTLAAAVDNDGNSLKAIGQGTEGGAGTNTSGFSALLAGYRNFDSHFYYLGSYTNFVSATEVDGNYAFTLDLRGSDSGIRLYSDPKEYGFSARCLRD